MSADTLAVIALVLAAIPAALVALNLLVYRPLPCSSRREEAHSKSPQEKSERTNTDYCGISVLIPARNEEHNIQATLDAVLASRSSDFEVIVLDDHSTDRTAAIVNEFAARDSRVRLESAPPLPSGWCGKQHACFVLAKLSRHPQLVFIDADVRLAPDALKRMTRFMTQSNAALASGVPRQELITFSERLLLPLIHFVLLGFLPMHAIRWTRMPCMSAGCGQLFVVRREAYEKCGGHARLRNSLHDGLKLPRVFRRAGLATSLFDATDVATCRMYQTNAETWRGLGKNATEALAAPWTIGPMTVLLLGGQVLPFVLLAGAPMLSRTGLLCAVVACALALAPRFIGIWRFRQPLASALLHPVGVAALLVIQWQALVRHLLGKPAEWKGRSYLSTTNIESVKTV